MKHESQTFAALGAVFVALVACLVAAFPVRACEPRTMAPAGHAATSPITPAKAAAFLSKAAPTRLDYLVLASLADASGVMRLSAYGDSVPDMSVDATKPITIESRVGD